MRRMLSVAAVLLLLTGGAAVAVGVGSQQAPPQPRTEQGKVGFSRAPAPSSPTSSGRERPAEPPAVVAPPVELRIDAIGVRSRLLTLGLNPDGSLQVPQPGPDYNRAAWFSGSPRPGELGPAVIEGHVDSADRGPSVFFKLGALRQGDGVTVVRADGTKARFVVYAVRSYAKSRFPSFDVYGNTPGPELRLVTCGGAFDRESGHYQDNIVVFAR